MSKWKEYPFAPNEGCFIANKKDVTAEPVALKIRTDKGEFPIIIMNRKNRILAYVNAFPHQYLPLDYRSNNLLSSDGKNLMCSVHGAMFEIKTGKGISNGVLGCTLDQVPVSIDNNGDITIGR